MDPVTSATLIAPAEAIKLKAKSAPTIERVIELFLSDKRAEGLETCRTEEVRTGVSAIQQFHGEAVLAFPA